MRTIDEVLTQMRTLSQASLEIDLKKIWILQYLKLAMEGDDRAYAWIERIMEHAEAGDPLTIIALRYIFWEKTVFSEHAFTILFTINDPSVIKKGILLE